MKQRFLSSLLLVLLLMLAVSASAFAADYAAVTVEKFTLNEGYLVEPTLVELRSGDTCADVLLRLLDDEGIDYQYSGQPSGGFYLQAVADRGSNSPRFPGYIEDYLAEYPKYINSNGKNSSGWLEEFDFFSQSGWMYCINDDFPNVGAADKSLRDGDVMRWQFTVCGLGGDLGSHYSASGARTEPLLTTADKDELTWAIAEINAREDKSEFLDTGSNQSAYNRAISVLEDIEASTSQVRDALAAVEEMEEAPAADDMVAVSGVSLSRSSLEMAVGQSYRLTATLRPSDAANLKLSWSSSKPAVADVDNDGRVEALAAGTATITVTTEDGGYQASCTVTVQPADAAITLPPEDGQEAPTSGNNPVGNPPAGPAVSIAVMQDITDPQSWYYTPVAFVLSSGLMTGTTATSFSPEARMTRGMFVTVLGRYCGIADSSALYPSGSAFADVEPTSYYASHIAWAVQSGLASGKAAASFAPNQPISREEMAAIIARFAANRGISLGNASAAAFADDGAIATYAKSAVYQLAGVGILTGRADGRFDPQGTASRAEVAAVLYRLLTLNQ